MKHLNLTKDQISDVTMPCTPCTASPLYDEFLGAVPQVPMHNPLIQSAGRAALFPPRERTGGKPKDEDMHGHHSKFLSLG
jgi:hypothetical protein